MTRGLHFGKWVNCPECDGRDIVDISPDDAPVFEFECLSCGRTWEQADIGLTLVPKEES